MVWGRNRNKPKAANKCGGGPRRFLAVGRGVLVTSDRVEWAADQTPFRRSRCPVICPGLALNPAEMAVLLGFTHCLLFAATTTRADSEPPLSQSCRYLFGPRWLPLTAQSVRREPQFSQAEAQLDDRHIAHTLIDDLTEFHLDLVAACFAPDDQPDIGFEIVAGGGEISH